MLINCPRCGFSQPKDQYCANCGVNIEKYVPEKVNFLKKLLSNTFVQVSLVIGFTLTTSYFVLKSRTNDNNPSMRRRQIISTMSNSSTSASSSNKAHSLSQNESSAAEAISSEEEHVSVELAAQNESQKNQLAGYAADAGPTTPVENTTPGAQSTKKLLSIAVKYSFYEIDRELLNYWLQLNNLTDQSEEAGGFQSGLVATEIMHKQIQSPPLKTETKKVGLIQKETFNAGISRDNSDSFVGFISEIKFDELNENQLNGTLRLTRKNTLGNELISVPLAIPKQNVLFLHWKNDVVGFDREASLNNVPPFQILRSARFLGQKTELVVIVEPLF